MELMLGYQGGVGAFLTGAASYNFDIEDLADRAYDTIPAHILEEANGFYDWTVKKKGNTFGLSRRAFVVCDSLKRMWREAHPNTGRLWKGLEAACIEATRHPGVTLTRGTYFEMGEEITVPLPVKVRRDGFYLRVVLPSGRALCYPGPRVDDKGQLTYMGNNQYTRQWSKIKTYGGKLVENLTQAAARDVLAHNMPQMEAEGYELVLTVHDEAVTETPDTDEYSSDRLSEILATNPPWAKGLPLAAAGFESYRYKKED
jgi:DNA polymerase bacteriophage-type